MNQDDKGYIGIVIMFFGLCVAVFLGLPSVFMISMGGPHEFLWSERTMVILTIAMFFVGVGAISVLAEILFGRK